MTERDRGNTNGAKSPVKDLLVALRRARTMDLPQSAGGLEMSEVRAVDAENVARDAGCLGGAQKSNGPSGLDKESDALCARKDYI